MSNDEILSIPRKEWASIIGSGLSSVFFFIFIAGTSRLFRKITFAENAVNNLTKSMEEVKTRLSQVEEKVVRIPLLEIKFGEMEKSMIRIDGRVGELEKSMARTEGKLNGLEMQLTTLTTLILKSLKKGDAAESHHHTSAKEETVSKKVD